MGVKVDVKVPVTWSVGVWKLGASRVSVGAPDWGPSIGAQLARNTNMTNKQNVCLMTTHLVVMDENPSAYFLRVAGYDNKVIITPANFYFSQIM